MATLKKAGEMKDLEPGTARLVQIDDKEIALFNVDGKLYAIDNTCPHRGGPLAEGVVDGDVVTCPWHGATFNIKTGEVLGPPSPTDVGSYRVWITGPDIEIEVP
jgi:nitrite reductase/ring-hydroxylating ferredoxin subunit